MKKCLFWLFLISFISNLLFSVNISNIDIFSKDEHLYISFSIEEDFPQQVIESINSGLETTFTFKIRLIKTKKLWFDKKIVDKVLISHVTYDPITKQYKLTKKINGSQIASLETDSTEEMDTWIREFEEIKICPSEILSQGTKYLVEIEGILFSRYLLKIIPNRYKIHSKKNFSL
ncbi:MAG: DUF4390 domain-containing protein [Candidatus Aminicenantia bacterium]